MKKKTAKKATAKPRNGLRVGVHVAASFERENHESMPYNGYEYTLKKITLDENDNLIANCGCRSAFICKRSEIESLRDFLSQVVDATAA